MRLRLLVVLQLDRRDVGRVWMDLIWRLPEGRELGRDQARSSAPLQLLLQYHRGELITLLRFIEHCLPAVSFFDPTEEDLHPVTLRNRSRLLYWAIIAVGSRESPGLENMFTTAEAKMLHFLRDTLGGGRPSYWDLCGAMVYNRWLAPIRPIGERNTGRTQKFFTPKESPT